MAKSVKRQKLEHDAAEHDEEASFASFSEDEDAENGPHLNDRTIDDDDDDAYDSLDSNAGDEGELEESGDDVEELAKADNESMRTKSTKLLMMRGHERTQNGHNRATSLNGRSSVFNAQVSEMLQQIRPKHTAREVEADTTLRAVKATIESIPARGPVPIGDVRRSFAKDRVVVPFPEPAPANDSNLKFAYSKPSSINVVGSYPMKTAARTRKYLYIDLVVQMPSTLFQDKDYLDNRYFHKRAFYLACVAAGLRAAHANLDIRFQHHHDDLLRPTITIRPQTVSTTEEASRPARNWQINVLPVIAEDVFSATKLTPDRNCLRKLLSDADVNTPSYNSSVRADMLVSAYLKLLHKASTTCEAYRDACALGSTWLKQRGFRATSRRGGIASFEWSALMALLLQGGGPGGRPLLSDRLDSSQLLKSTLQLLATRDLVKQPLSIGSGHEFNLTDLGIPVLWDAGRGHNLFFKMTPWSFKRLQTEARITLTMLGDQQTNNFEATFIMKKDIDLLDNDMVVDAHIKHPARLTQGAGSASYTRLFDVLSRGLADRVKSIQISAARSKPWALDAAFTASKKHDHLSIGLLVNPDTVHRTVDHGPSVEDKDAAASFRKFWGEKAELRRFKDGTISEALIWDGSSSKAPVLQQVLQYLLHLHFGVDVERDLAFNIDIQAQILGSHVMTHIQLRALEAFKVLERDIWSLDGLPLPVRQIVPAEMDESDTDNKTRIKRPRSVVLQFESSGRWPDDLAAIQRTKIAFLLKLTELLLEADLPLDARVGLENQEVDIRNQGFLEVAYHDGSAYHIRIFHDREQTLLERRLKDKTIDSKSIEVAAMALAAYKRDFLRRPAHAQAISQLCSRHPALRGTIQLLQRWFASHVLANHFEHEIVELLAARSFVQSWPWQSPNSVQTAFLRTIAWLARWDWRFEPLIVDMSSNHELRKEALAAINTRFEAWRKLDPAFNRVAVFAASNVDSEGTTYTNESPSKVVVSRLVTLARAAFQEIQAQGVQLDARNLFSSSLLDYNFVIHLNPTATAHKRNKGAQTFKNLELDALTDPSMVGSAPAIDFLQELDATYGAAILFFSGVPHKPVIGGVWTPHTADRPWKVNLAYSTTPSASKDGQIVAQINKHAILAEIARLGGDIVDRIEVS